jgi:hypothetical protein
VMNRASSDRRSVRGALWRGTTIEIVGEDGFDRTIGARDPLPLLFQSIIALEKECELQVRVGQSWFEHPAAGCREPEMRRRASEPAEAWTSAHPPEGTVRVGARYL